MLNAIELDTEITPDHVIHLKLPDRVRARHVRVIVLYETNEEPHRVTQSVRGNLDDFLTALPRNGLGRDRKEIAKQIETERCGWD